MTKQEAIQIVRAAALFMVASGLYVAGIVGIVGIMYTTIGTGK